MKTKSLLLLVLPAIFFISSAISAPQKHQFTFKVKGLANQTVLLGSYFGDKTYVIDSAKSDSKGSFTFSGDTALPAGVYLVVQKNHILFEFMVDKEQKFTMSTDTADVVKFMKVEGSPENQLFYDYRRYAASSYTKVEKLEKEVKAGPDKDGARKKLDSINLALTKYKKDFVAKHPDILVSKIFMATETPDVPPTPTLPNGRKDSSFAFKFYKAHFFDNLDFSDSRMVRTPTPVFFDRIKEYITKLTLQQADSIDAAADYLISKTKGSPDMFKFLVYWITNNYENSNIMGLDAVFVHMVKTYYTPDKAYWVSASQLEKMQERADQLAPILVGKKTPEVALPDTSDVMKSLLSVNSPYTILYFWDFDCGLCQQETPRLVKWYDSAKASGIEVFAVQTNPDPVKWKDYVKKHKLDWINVCDVYRTTNVQTKFDVLTTPMIYVLNKDKIILAKKIDMKDLNGLIKNDIRYHPYEK